MARDSLARLVAGADRARAGKFSGSVPGRTIEARTVCPACRQVPDYATHRMAYERPFRDAGWLPSSWRYRSWCRRTAGAWEWQDYTYQRPEGCPTCGGELVEIEGW